MGRELSSHSGITRDKVLDYQYEQLRKGEGYDLQEEIECRNGQSRRAV